MKRTFLIQLLASLALASLVLLIHAWSHPLSLVLMHLYSRAVLPLACLALPLWAAFMGLDPYAAFFPPLLLPGLSFLWLRLPLPVWVVMLSFFLSVLGASIGQEMRRRRME